MPGSITPLPVMLSEEESRIRDQSEPPKTLLCRYGYQKMIAELPYNGDVKVGCGSKLVVVTNRGVEMAEMLTSTCANAGCAKSVSRKEVLQYVENSGGKDYPFSTQGRVLRVASVEDLNEQSRLDARKPEIIQFTKALIREMDLPMRLVDVELLLGGERLILFFTSQQWVDFREPVKRLASEYQTRIEMQQVNAREEARLVADYEKCGQYCCCKTFLKVLKPVSMRSAKVQKATLDPVKISGRCGRLMCCLRYEDETYSDLRKRLPHRQSRVETDDGPGVVIDTQILTQLVLVKVDNVVQPASYPLENIRALSSKKSAASHSQGKRTAPESTETSPSEDVLERADESSQAASAVSQDQQKAPKPPAAENALGGVAGQASGDSQDQRSRSQRNRRRRRRKRT